LSVERVVSKKELHRERKMIYLFLKAVYLMDILPEHPLPLCSRTKIHVAVITKNKELFRVPAMLISPLTPNMEGSRIIEEGGILAED
jgi:hypothetical protein